MPQVLVISDIHGNLEALRAVWNDVSRRTIEHVLFLGDLVAFGPRPAETLAFLRDQVKPTVAVRGNTDRYILEKVWEKKKSSLDSEALAGLKWTAAQLSRDDMAYLDSLTSDTTYTVDDVRLFLCHAAPGNDEIGITADTARQSETGLDGVDANVLLCGHTHVPYRTRLDQLEVINVGSVGFPFDADVRACYLSFFIGDGALREVTFCRVSYNRGKTRGLLEAIDAPWARTSERRLATGRLAQPPT